MRRSSLTFSGVFHLTVLVIAAVGLPYMHREFVIPPPIVVDFIDISKVTQTDKVVTQPVQPPEKPEPKKEEPPPPPPAAQNTAAAPAAPIKEPPPPEVKKEIQKLVKAETVDENAPPDKAKKPPKKEEAKAEPKKDFSSVLKNLAVPKDKSSPVAPDLKANGQPVPGQNAPIGARLTMSEEDALRSQLEKCWNVPFGAKDAENMAVDIFMVINPDRTLREAKVVDTARYNSDTFFRAAADSALRAVRSPLCSPFALPPDKYDTWNSTTVTFNPKDMF
jgi:outer membrane biosynthesis protein TonB